MKRPSANSLGKLSKGALTSDINVTPLVDVCLVLLIIFMVVTPMLQKGVPVNLPVTDEPEATPDTEKQLQISVKAVFSGGSARDISMAAVYESANPSVTISSAGLVRSDQPTETTVLVRFFGEASSSDTRVHSSAIRFRLD